MGQIKNIKLHIVTDIKSQSSTTSIKMGRKSWADLKERKKGPGKKAKKQGDPDIFGTADKKKKIEKKKKNKNAKGGGQNKSKSKMDENKAWLKTKNNDYNSSDDDMEEDDIPMDEFPEENDVVAKFLGQVVAGSDSSDDEDLLGDDPEAGDDSDSGAEDDEIDEGSEDDDDDDDMLPIKRQSKELAAAKE